MIITRSWLNEWISLDGITTEELCKTFNAIGLEVDRVETYEVPKKIVLGKVLECEQHPDADKLSVCKVDIGSTTRQIVCGAANVRTGLYVAVATIGAEMPGGLKIKPVKLRGVDSEGMICSSNEIGLPKTNDGIMERDESIGELKLGQELCENPHFRDDLIEIELTANRGDCLSIHGVARDLSAAFNRPLKDQGIDSEEERRLGIGRVMQFSHGDLMDVELKYRAIDFKGLNLPFMVGLRLAQIEEQKDSAIESLLFYATYSSGVILRAYDAELFKSGEEGKAQVKLEEDENGFAAIAGTQKASVVGIIQEDASRVGDAESTVLLEASYIPPDIISRKMSESKIKSGPLYYRTSRGSEPELGMGMAYAVQMLERYSGSDIYGGCIDLSGSYSEKVVTITIDEINAFIGMDVEKSVVVQLLSNLGFNINKSQGDNFVISVPRFRHDIVNKQDVVEEIVRLVGIDNIQSKPFVFAEENRLDDDYAEYKKRRIYRQRAAQSGFYESVHFVFNERSRLEAYGFECVDKELELLNPIVNTLDTLRPTILLSLLESASQNAKSGRKQVALFEVGSVVDSKRNESLRMSFLFSGNKERDALSNGGKPEAVDFAYFTQKISDVIGDVELKPCEMSHRLAHPFQSAEVVQNGVSIGTLFKLHPTVQENYDLDAAYMCELDFEKLEYGLKQASPFSKFQVSFRDLSVVAPEAMAYDAIKSVIEKASSDEVVRFYPVDRYQDEAMGENVSMTIRFVLQSHEKTLEEEDITGAMGGILSALESDLGLELR